MFPIEMQHIGKIDAVGTVQVFGYSAKQIDAHTADMVYLNYAGPPTASDAVWAMLIERRARGLRLVEEELRRSWLVAWGVMNETYFLFDTKPVPVVGYQRSKRHSQFAGSAAYGYCESRKLHYFGYKLVTMTTLAGLPVVCELVPANLDEREAAEAMLFYLHNCDLFGDKGFIGQEWQARMRHLTGNRIWTVKRTNQHDQNPAPFDALLCRVRERIEGTFNAIQNTGRNLERLLAKNIVGLCTRIIAKIASHALKLLLRRDFGIDVQTFVFSSA